MQIKTLSDYGCEQIYIEIIARTKHKQPELTKALAFISEGDELVVSKLNRLGKNVKEINKTVAMIEEKGAELVEWKVNEADMIETNK